MKKDSTINLKILDKTEDVGQIPLSYFDNKAFIISIFSNEKYEYYHNDVWNSLSKSMQQDTEILMLALKQDIIRLDYLEPKTRKKLSTAQLKKAIEYNPYNIKYANEQVLKDRTWLKKIIQNEGFAFGILAQNPLCDSYSEDIELAKIASETYANTVMFVLPEVLNELSIVKNCLEQDLSVFMHLPKNIKENDYVVQHCVDILKQKIKDDEKTVVFASMLSKKHLKDQTLMQELNVLQPTTYCFMDDELRQDCSMLCYSFSKDIIVFHSAPVEIINTVADAIGIKEIKLPKYYTSSTYEDKIKEHKEDILTCLHHLALEQKLQKELNESSTKKLHKHKL